MNLKISHCKKCGYWFDANARYFHELKPIEKILYCFGWVLLPGWLALVEVFRDGGPFHFDNLRSVLISIFISPIVVVLGFVIDTVVVAMYIVLNALAFPISFPYNMIKLILVNSRWKKEHQLLNDAFLYVDGYAPKPKYHSVFPSPFPDEYYQTVMSGINWYLNDHLPKKPERKILTVLSYIGMSILALGVLVLINYLMTIFPD